MTEPPSDQLVARFQNTFGGAFSPRLAALAYPRTLLSHLGLMLTVTAVLALMNLILDPAGLWSRALLIVWMVLLVAHAIGIVMLRLLADDTAQLTRARAYVVPEHGPASSWSRTTPYGGGPDANGNGHVPPNGTGTDPWRTASPPASETADLAWPEAPALPVDQPARDRQADDSRANEKVPWRAATEVAWLRNRRDPRNGSRSPEQDSAS